MRVLLRIKWSFLGYTYSTTRKGWGLSHDDEGNWTIGELPTVKETDFKGAKQVYNKHGITIATVAAMLEAKA